MDNSRRRRHARRAVLAGVAAAVLLASLQLAAKALTNFETPTPVTGNTTYFYGWASLRRVRHVRTQPRHAELHRPQCV